MEVHEQKYNLRTELHDDTLPEVTSVLILHSILPVCSSELFQPFLISFLCFQLTTSVFPHSNIWSKERVNLCYQCFGVGVRRIEKNRIGQKKICFTSLLRRDLKVVQ